VGATRIELARAARPPGVQAPAVCQFQHAPTPTSGCGFCSATAPFQPVAIALKRLEQKKWGVSGLFVTASIHRLSYGVCRHKGTPVRGAEGRISSKVQAICGHFHSHLAGTFVRIPQSCGLPVGKPANSCGDPLKGAEE
jgi:hypothetical protein